MFVFSPSSSPCLLSFLFFLLLFFVFFVFLFFCFFVFLFLFCYFFFLVGGTDLTHSYTCVFFEPLYPIVASYKDMSLEHRGMIEDIFYHKIFNEADEMREWRLVGFLSNEEQRSSQQQGRAKLRRNHARNPTQPSLEENLFLSLSMEDHSGASSTCFAFCCAGAQPFHQQQAMQRAQMRHGGGGAVAKLQQHTQLHGRAALPERKRRHSIGNVGLHAQASSAAVAAAAASASAAGVSGRARAASSSESTCSIHGTCPLPAPNAADDTSHSCSCASASPDSSSSFGGGCSSSSTAPRPRAVQLPPGVLSVRPVRAASICMGTLAAFTASQLALSPSAAASFMSSYAQSPRRRINSADHQTETDRFNFLAQSPKAAAASAAAAAPAAAAAALAPDARAFEFSPAASSSPASRAR